MGSYSYIPEDGIKELLASRLGKLVAKLIGVQQGTMAGIINRLKSRILNASIDSVSERIAPTLCDTVIPEVEKTIKTITDFLYEVRKALSTIKRALELLRDPIATLNRIVNLVLALPIPQAVFGIGIPVNVTTNLSSVLERVKEFISQIKTTIQSIVGERQEDQYETDEEGNEIQPRQIVEEEELEPIPEKSKIENVDLKGVRVIATEALGILDMALAFVTKIELFLGRIQGIITLAKTYCVFKEVLDEIDNRPLLSDNAITTNNEGINNAIATNLNPQELDGLDRDRLNDFLLDFEQELLDLLNAMSYALSDQVIPGRTYEVRTTEIVQLLDDFEDEVAIPDGIKSRLRAIALEGQTRYNTIRGVAPGADRRRTPRAESDLTFSFPDILEFTSGENVGDISISTPTGPLEIQRVSDIVPDINGELYEAIDGNTYLLTIEDDPKSTYELAKRRFGAARTVPENVIVFKSSTTFTLETSVILQSLRAELDAQLIGQQL